MDHSSLFVSVFFRYILYWVEMMMKHRFILSMMHKEKFCNLVSQVCYRPRSPNDERIYLKKQNIPQRTIYNILKRYLTYNTTKDRVRSGRSVKLSDKNLTDIVKSDNNRCGISQRKIGRRFNVHQSTILRNLRKRTSIVIRKREKTPKMNNKEQEKRARQNCGKLYRQLLNGCDLIFWMMKNISK